MFRTPIYRELARSLPDVVGAATAKKLAAIGLHTLDDLLRHVPRRYIAGTGMSSFEELQVGEDVAVIAKVISSTVVYGSKTRVAATIADDEGRRLDVTLFVPGAKAQYLGEYWKGLLRPGDRGLFAGKVSVFRDQLQLSHPDFVMLDGARITGGKNRKKSAKQQAEEANRQAMGRIAQSASMVGIYPATSSFRTWMVAETIQMMLPTIDEDPLPGWLVDEAGQPSFTQALHSVHQPVNRAQAERGIDRLRFDEAFGIQLAMAYRRATMASEEAVSRKRVPGGLLDALDDGLPFPLTDGQRDVGETIFEELAGQVPMHRLLQGDVGSGKTLVALRAMCAVVDDGGQAVLVAPTEVLAKQHFASIKALLGELGQGRDLAHPRGTHVALLTGSMSATDKRATLNQIVTGEAGIIVGTHALFSDPVDFFDLGLVVIDEQHRFGVEQRAALSKKAAAKPHTLVMTATPIPRSIAMTIFGDLAVSELRELPAGRGDVQTVFVDTVRKPGWVTRAWERIREEVTQGRQAFVVCPAISPDDASTCDGRTLTAVTSLANELAAGPLQGLRLGIVHGRQSAVERDETMTAFAAGELDVIVSTTVIEVGVDVPNASVMVICDADRFGISQLHQLRGRIGRGSHAGLCLLLAPLGDDDVPARTRLEAVAASRDGFHLAEVDLSLRREGDVLGAGQSGASSLRILRIADVDLIQQAKQLAERVVADPRSTDDPLLADLLEQATQVAAGEWLEKG